jgi:hypothetical protein
MRYTVRKSFIDVVGKIWMPAVTCSLRINLRAYDIENIRGRVSDNQITREDVESWLMTHSGDFQSVEDFSASIEDGDQTLDFPFATEAGELAYMDTMSDSE